MNIKTTILSTIAIIAAASAATPAFAGDGGGMQRPGARFSFAPSVYKIEEPRMPQGYGQPAPAVSQFSVRHGVTPKGSSVLGFDPKTLQAARPAPTRGPRVAPMAQQQVSGIPSWTAMVPQLNPFATPVANKGQFGAPLQAPVVAALPPQASKPPAVKPTAPATSNSLTGVIKQPRRSTTAVAARRLPQPSGLRAKSGSGIQSYGNQFYASGSTAPTSSGTSTHTNVSGVVLYKSTNKH